MLNQLEKHSIVNETLNISSHNRKSSCVPYKVGLRILWTRKTTYAFMLKQGGAAILTNYDSFLHQKCFSDSPKNMYCRSQNMNNQKHWYTPYFWLSTNISWHQCPQYIQDTSWFRLTLLQIDISSFMAFRQRNTSWWTQHLHTHGTPAVLAWYTCTNWPHLFGGKILYYASVI